MGNEIASDLEVLHLEGNVQLAAAAASVEVAMGGAGVLRRAAPHRRRCLGIQEEGEARITNEERRGERGRPGERKRRQSSHVHSTVFGFFFPIAASGLSA